MAADHFQPCCEDMGPQLAVWVFTLLQLTLAPWKLPLASPTRLLSRCQRARSASSSHSPLVFGISIKSLEFLVQCTVTYTFILEINSDWDSSLKNWGKNSLGKKWDHTLAQSKEGFSAVPDSVQVGAEGRTPSAQLPAPQHTERVRSLLFATCGPRCTRGTSLGDSFRFTYVQVFVLAQRLLLRPPWTQRRWKGWGHKCCPALSRGEIWIRWLLHSSNTCVVSFLHYRYLFYIFLISFSKNIGWYATP